MPPKLEDSAQKSCHCEFCGFNNFLSDRKKYWTLSPLLVQAGLVLASLAGTWDIERFSVLGNCSAGDIDTKTRLQALDDFFVG